MPTWTALHPVSSVRAWLSSSHVYIAGRFEGEATRPDAESTPVSIGGVDGWQTEAHGMVSVVLPLSSGQTMFFAGADTPAHIQSLAANVLAHLDSALPPEPIPATVDPTAWC
jgi:hypothetical protein